jgi:hypothetical protein
MRWLSQLLIVSIICLIAAAIPGVPAQAVCVPYDIQVSPKYGPPGTNVTVYGHDFYTDKLVDIYYDGDLMTTGITRTDSAGDFTFNLTIPEDCQGYYRVLVDAGYVEVDTYFHVRPGLTINPETGPAGTNVTVKGMGFAANEGDIELVYYLGVDDPETMERQITANALGSWETIFQVPLSAGGRHKIDAQGTESQSYDVIDATFRVTAQMSMDKSSGIPGDTVTMTGSRFAVSEKGIKIVFGGQELVTDIRANSNGEWEASFKVPEMPAGNYDVTAEGPQTKKEDAGQLSFHIGPYMALSPSEGHVGTDVTVTGNGFAVNQTVSVMYDGNQMTAAETDGRGNFEASFAVPEGHHGEHSVMSGDAAGNDGTAIFVMESNHPDMPIPVSPASGGRLGFMGDVAPTFGWCEVSDDSGVRYSLQIATTDDFAASSIIASVTGLTETGYTLNETLPNGAYYWRVEAVDGAENESGWTAARSFRVGLLPRWGFILIIAAVAAVLLAFGIRALVRRRSIYYDRW